MARHAAFIHQLGGIQVQKRQSLLSSWLTLSVRKDGSMMDQCLELLPRSKKVFHLNLGFPHGCFFFSQGSTMQVNKLLLYVTLRLSI